MWYEYLPNIAVGAVLTVQLALLSLVIACISGMITVTLQLSAPPWVGVLVRLYINTLRGIPELVLMLLAYYGGQLLVNAVTDKLGMEFVDINPFVSGCLSLGLLYGAYFSETFRGAYLSIAHGQREAARSYCLSPRQMFWYIDLPQLARYAMPGFINNWLVLMKGTAIVSVIGLTDLTWLADQAGRTTKQPLLFYLIVCVAYLLFTFVSTKLLGWLDRYLNRPYSRSG